MPKQDDEQEKVQDEVAEVSDESEETSADEQNADAPDETLPEAGDGKGELGDEEQVVGDHEPPKTPGKFKRFFAGYWRKKKWTLPVTLLLAIVIILAVPASRYPLLALGIKRQFNVVVMDSKTDTPVSGATVTLGGQTAMTDSAGKATLTAKVGKRHLNISKKYYKNFTESAFVGVSSSHNSSKVNLQATGRQLFIKVANKITGKPVANAEIKVLDTNAKTDSNGLASIVLPNISSGQTATITASGYNTLTGKLQVVDIYLTYVVAGKATNGTPYVNYNLTPSGRVYFLSNLSGNIDVVSTNLDGTDRKTVLAGTGNEDPNDTVLLASRDWQYLALLSKRDGGQYAKLFLINTTNNQVTTMDEGSATFTPVGWSGHYFVYEVNRANVNNWQSGAQALKSYNADNDKLAVLDQTAAQGSSTDYLWQTFGTGYGGSASAYLTGDKVVYAKEWNGPGGIDAYNGGSLHFGGKQDQIVSVSPDGSDKQVLKAITTPNNYLDIFALAYKPGIIYFQAQTYNNGPSNVYYEYENNTVTQTNTITDASYSQTQQNNLTYLE